MSSGPMSSQEILELFSFMSEKEIEDRNKEGGSLVAYTLEEGKHTIYEFTDIFMFLYELEHPGKATALFNVLRILDCTLHRTDGPAVEWQDVKKWYLEGVKYESQELLDQKLSEIKNIPLELRLTDPRKWVREL